MLPLLPDDLISEILSWVPVKPVCRFRCVCKGWYALISGRTFVAAHKSRAEPLLMSVTNSKGEISSVLRFMDMDGNTLKVINMAGLWGFNYGVDGPLCFTLGICVPGQNLVVNMIDLGTGTVMRTYEELDFRSIWNLGVGLAVPSRTYKLVGLMTPYSQQPCMVLTVKDGTKWRKVQSPLTPSLVTTGYNKGSPVTVNGVMHFLYKFVDGDYVFRFHLESEEWNASIKGPTRSGDKVEEKILAKCMVKLNDALCVVQWSSKNIWFIWRLTDTTKGTWVKAYTIPIASTFNLLMPLMVMRDGRKLLLCARMESMSIWTLQVYDPLTETCTHLVKFASNLVGSAGLYNLHLECFVSPRISLVTAPSV